MKKISTFIFAILLACAVIPLTAGTAYAGNISYTAYENGSFVTKSIDAQQLTANGSLHGKTYYAPSGKMVFTERIEATGTNAIILCDGAELVFEKGISLEYASSLTIYAQSQDPAKAGRMTAYGKGGNAAIGGRRGVDGAEAWTERCGKPGGAVSIHGGNIDIYSDTVAFGGGEGGKGAAEEKAGDGGSSGGGSIYGGNIVMHTGTALYGGGRGGDGGVADHGTAEPTTDPVFLFVGGSGGDGGNGGYVSHVHLFGGTIKLPSGASLVHGGDGGNGGKGVDFLIDNINLSGTFKGTAGGDGGEGGYAKDIDFCDGKCSVSGGGTFITAGSGGSGGDGGSVTAPDVTWMAVDDVHSGNGGNGGNGGIAQLSVRGGDSAVQYKNTFLRGGSGGRGGDYGIAATLAPVPLSNLVSGNSGESGSGNTCELNLYGGKLTVSGDSGRLMSSGKVIYYERMGARLGGALSSLGDLGHYTAGDFGNNSCMVIEPAPELSLPCEHDGNNYWLNEDYTSELFLPDTLRGNVSLDLKGHTWKITGDKTFGYGVNLLEIKNGTLIFTNPYMEAIVIDNGLQLTNVTFKDCTCKRLFKVAEGLTAENNCPQFSVENCVFKDCSFTENGGIFYFACKQGSPRWEYYFYNDIFYNIRTTKSGSVIYAHAYDGRINTGPWPSLDMIGCTFDNCHADNMGGAIYAFDNMRVGNIWDSAGKRSEYNVRSNLFAYCSAGVSGGALSNGGWDASTVLCTFADCTSPNGAVDVGGQPVHFDKCDFVGNKKDIYHTGDNVEEKDMIYDMSVLSGLSGSGTEKNPYILKNAYDIAYLAAKCAMEDTKYSYAIYKLANDITNVFTPVTGFNGIIIPNGKKITTRFVSSAFSGDYGVDGTLTVENALGKVTTEKSKSNFRFFEVGSHYHIRTNDTKTYIRPGASSISVTFSNDTAFRTLVSDTAYIYDGKRNLIGEYQRDSLRNKTIDIPGDTVIINFVAHNVQTELYGNDTAGANGYKVAAIKAKYPDASGFTLSAGNWWIIGGSSAVAIAAVVTILLVRAKKKSKAV